MELILIESLELHISRESCRFFHKSFYVSYKMCVSKLLPSSVKPQLPAAAKLAELQPYFAFHPPAPTPRASRFLAAAKPSFKLPPQLA